MLSLKNSCGKGETIFILQDVRVWEAQVMELNSNVYEQIEGYREWHVNMEFSNS